MTEADMEVESTPAEGVADSPGGKIANAATPNYVGSSPTSAVANVYAKDSSSSTKPDTISSNSSVVFSPELLNLYYSRLFPFELLHGWLAYDPCHNPQNSWIFSRREFSMTIEPTPGEEIYIRYQSFASQQELTQAILKRRPTKIDLGAVFTHPPKDHKTLQKGKLMPVQRELVFDIDLTDYDDIRHCGCKGANICSKCWVYMTMAVEVLDAGLKKDFGFVHVAWFYSGRRGIHAWICDETARTLSNEARNAVASYFEVQLANENNKDAGLLRFSVHPALKRAFDILEPWFISDIIPASGHGLLASADRWTKDLLDTLPEAASHVATVLKRKWQNEKNSTAAEKWDQLKKHIKVLIGRSNDKKTAKTMDGITKERLENWPIEVVFRHTYPRLDIAVSKTMNHLLKSPFCVHPKTGRVCVPISASKIREFDPFAVPTLAQLVSELDDFERRKKQEESGSMDTDEENGTRKRTIKHDWQKTSLKEYFQPFQRAFLEPLQKEIRSKEKSSAEEEAALRGDF